MDADEDSISEELVRSNLELFLPYICDCVRATDLLVHLPMFSREQRKEIFSKSTCRGQEATQIALEVIMHKTDEPGRYKALLEALQDREYTKVVKILQGRHTPCDANSQKIVDLYASELIGRLRAVELLPMLLSYNVIDQSDSEEIRAEEMNHGNRRACWLMLYYLPCREKNWFKYFLLTLMRTRSQKDLAQKLDPDLYDKLLVQQRETKSSSLASLQEQSLSLMYEAPLFGTHENILSDDEPAAVDERVGSAVASSTDPDQDVIEKDTIEDTKEFINDFLDKSLDFSSLVITEDRAGVATTEPSGIEAPAGKNRITYTREFLLTLQDSPLTHYTPIGVGKYPDIQLNRAPREFLARNLNSQGKKDIKQTWTKSGIQGTSEAGKPIAKPQLNFDNLLSIPPDNMNIKQPNVSADETNVKTIYTRQHADVDNSETVTQTGEPRDESLLDFDELLSRPSAGDNTEVKHREASPDETSVKTLYTRQPPHGGDAARRRDDTGRRDSDSSDEENMDDDFEKLLLGDLKADKEHENDLSADTNSSDVEMELNIKTDEDKLEDTEDRDIELRGYQRELARAGCEGENVIVMAPTNSGKTRVACAIIQEHMRACRRQCRLGRVIFIVENEALAGQQGTVCADQLSAYRTKVISGSIQRDKQQYLKDFYDRRDILVVTAQVLVNALRDKEISSVAVFSMIVFDECHHNDGGHPYNQIMITYMDMKLNKNNQLPLPQIIGLTASVGVGGFIDPEKALGHIKTILANLDASYLCTVRENVQELRKIQNPPVEEIVVVPARNYDIFHGTVYNCMQGIDQYISAHQCMANLDEDDEMVKGLSRVPLGLSGSEQFIQWLSQFRKAIGFVRSDDAREVLNRCRHHLEVYNKALMVHRDARVKEACQLLHVYMGDQIDQNTRKDDTDRHLLNIYESVQNIDVSAIPDSPKLLRLKHIILGILGNDPDARGIIFVKTRELARALVRWTKETTELAPLKASEFVGQVASATDGGMTKNSQKDILEYFRGGRHRLIIATSVAEEGLDIAKCNLVIRYEHVTSMIVRLQSRGRARAEDSRYFVVTQEGSPIAQREEKNRRLEQLMQELVPVVQNEIEADQNAWQLEMRSIQKMLKAKRARQQEHDDETYRIQCMNCPQFICWSSDIKQIQNAHHIVIDYTVKERIVTVRSPFPLFEESELKYDGGIYCQNCTYKLGGVCEYKQVEFPLLKIKCIRIVDETGHGQSEKKWKKVPFTVEKFTLDDLKEVVDRKLAEEDQN